MRPRSIRWQLPLSYAAIALLCTLALGAVLLTALRGYYEDRENDYLNLNADAITNTITEMIAENTPLAVIRAQIASYSFLSRVRIRLLDPDGHVLADSGVPNGRNLLSISAQSQPAIADEISNRNTASTSNLTQNCHPGNLPYRLVPDECIDLADYSTSIQMPIDIPIDSASNSEYYMPVITLAYIRTNNEYAGTIPTSPTAVNQQSFTYEFPTSSTLFGVVLNDEVARNGHRSGQFVNRIITGENGVVRGTVELSDSPAYGQQIVGRVAQGWLFASGLAIIVAVAAGWTISRRISVPLTTLTAATTRMAEGNLSVRAAVNRNDELGALAKAFNEMANRVEETVTTLRRFVADAAHEVHTPLTALRTNLELAIDETNWGARRTYIERAREQLKRLVSLTDGLLDLSRIEAKITNDEHKPIQLCALVQEISELYASRSEQLAVNFDLSLPDYPVIVYGNASQLRCALSNLMDNAIKFTPCGETVSVEMREIEGWVQIQVQDRGIGIPPDEVSMLFSRFHRCRNAVTYPGNGLGLAIVRSIADSHKGRITVKDTCPGTNFTLHLRSPQMMTG